MAAVWPSPQNDALVMVLIKLRRAVKSSVPAAAGIDKLFHFVFKRIEVVFVFIAQKLASPIH